MAASRFASAHFLAEESRDDGKGGAEERNENNEGEEWLNAYDNGRRFRRGVFEQRYG